jgi:hypothetical protein
MGDGGARLRLEKLLLRIWERGEDDTGGGSFWTGPTTIESSSSMDGSAGGGPSIAQRRDSYFDRMKDSILLKSILEYQ